MVNHRKIPIGELNKFVEAVCTDPSKVNFGMFSDVARNFYGKDTRTLRLYLYTTLPRSANGFITNGQGSQCHKGRRNFHRDGKKDVLAQFLRSKFNSSEDMDSFSTKQGGLASEAFKALDLGDTAVNRKWIVNLFQRNNDFKERARALMHAEKESFDLESS